MKPTMRRRHTGWVSEREGIQYACFQHKGKRYRESSNSTRVGDAQRLLERMRRQVLAGTYVPAGERAQLEREELQRITAAEQARELSTIEKLTARWLETAIATSRNPKGQKQAAARARDYLVPFLGDRPVADVTPEDLRRYRLWLEARKAPKLSVRTVHHILSDARAFFSWAAESQYVARSPLPRKLFPKPPEEEPKALSDAEVDTLTALPEPYGFACRLLLGTGVRWGELVTLQASDVKDGALVLTAPKTGKLRRIPLRPELLAEIKQHVGKLVPWGEGKDYFVFLKAARKLSQLETFAPHRCRHTFAYRWIWNGGNLSALQLVMGHASIETTQIYAKPTDALVRREAERQWAAEAEASTA